MDNRKVSELDDAQLDGVVGGCIIHASPASIISGILCT